jgi:hypothetical protein
MKLIDSLLSKLSQGLHWLGDRVKPVSEPVRYLPPDPIGEIITRKNKGKPTYFLKYRTKDGKPDYKYLSRDKAKAEEKREELSGWLLNDGMN